MSQGAPRATETKKLDKKKVVFALKCIFLKKTAFILVSEVMIRIPRSLVRHSRSKFGLVVVGFLCEICFV